MSAIVVEGHLVHYEVLGRGRPVILLHGMIGSWRYWVPLLQRLQQSYRLYALDLFGFGDSAHSPDHFALGKQVELVQAFMDEMGLPKAALIGHGLGALVAAEFARLHPDRAARLLLVSLPLFDTGDLDHRAAPAPIPIAAPAPLPVPPAPSAPQKPAEAPLPVASAGASAAMRAALAEAARARRPAAEEPRPAPAPAVTAEPPAPKPAAPSAPTPHPADSPRRNDLAPILAQPLDALLARCYRRSDETYPKLAVDVAKAHPQAAVALAGSYDAGSLLDLMRALPMPTVAVHGNDDAVFPPPPEEVWAYITADAERVFLPILLPGVRHFPMLEDERFYRIVTDFLELPDITRIEIRERWRRRTR